MRREPPAFRRVEVRRTERLSSRFVRVTLAGPELDGFTVDEPAASVRILLPTPPSQELVMPTWNGNEFLLPDGARPALRTFTPRRADPAATELDIDVVLHGHGVASTWAADAQPGDDAAVSGPGRGYELDPAATHYLLAGDETAVPAIGQLLEVIPAATAVDVHVAGEADAPLPTHRGATVHWHDDLVEAVTTAAFPDNARIWVAGEAATVQRIRKHLFNERGVSREQATVRGYWKRGVSEL